jgi:ribosomal protein S18 acetylase RimI-like enzyme
MTIVLRDATPDDHDGIRTVQRRTWLATYPNAALGITSADVEAVFDDPTEEARQQREERWRGINATPLAHLWVAESDAEIVGMCLARKHDQKYHVQALYVLPEYQRQGIGKRLLQAALDWIGTARPITLNVAAYNDHAIAFYQRMGFTFSAAPAESEVARLPSGTVIPELEMVKNSDVPEG